MPPSSQNLYFHLGMRADDDGVVEAHTVIKLTDSKPDDYKVLLAKRFIYELNDDLVVVIMDWREHNLIRPDRKIDSIYKELLKEKLPEIELLESKPRSDTGKPTGQPMDVQRTTNGPHRLGKGSVGKVRKGYNIYTPDFLSFYDAYPKHVEKKKAFAIWKRRELPEEEVAKIMDFLQKAKKTKKWQEGFIPNPTTFLNGDIWNDDLSAYGGVDKKGGDRIWV